MSVRFGMLMLLKPPFDFAPPRPNPAPWWVFALLGAGIGLVALLLYLTTGMGGEKDHWYGDPARRYHLPYSRYGPFGGFGHF